VTPRIPRPRPAGRAARRALAGDLLLGVDFTSAPSRRKPITVAIGRWNAARRRPRYRLVEVLGLETLDEFRRFLETSGPWLGGFDLPFGQPRPLVEHEGWPTEWPAFVEFYCGCPRPLLRETFRRWCDARPPGHKFAWRKTDTPAGSSPAMRWANPPVAWMMHAGIGPMLAAGLAFPAHRRPPARGRPRRIALEAYPGFTARQVCRESYKSDVIAAQTAPRAAARRTILAALVAGTAGLDVRLEISAAWSRRLLADGGGDLIDAVICGLQAGHAAMRRDYGLPRDLDPLEGWIAAVPPSPPVPPAPGNRSSVDSAAERGGRERTMSVSATPTYASGEGLPMPARRRRRQAQAGCRKRSQLRESEGREGRSERPVRRRGQPRTQPAR